VSFYTSIFKAFGAPLRRLMAPVMRPVTRVLVGVIAIPIFRFILTKIFRLKEVDVELEKDLEQWFRGSLLLLAATANMEHLFFFWLGFDEQAAATSLTGQHWFSTCLRLVLAIGVVEAMPDQELFAVIHPGPPPIRPHRGVLREVWKKKKLIIKGLVCQHLNRLSPVMAIMCAIFGGRYSDNPERWFVGWACYGLAIFQYLIIGLVTSRDRAMDVLSEFDRAVAKRRRELIREFDIKDSEQDKKARWSIRRSWKRWRSKGGKRPLQRPVQSTTDLIESTPTTTTLKAATPAIGSDSPQVIIADETRKKAATDADSGKSVVADGPKPDN
jgi:hypothetical protein